LVVDSLCRSLHIALYYNKVYHGKSALLQGRVYNS